MNRGAAMLLFAVLLGAGALWFGRHHEPLAAWLGKAQQAAAGAADGPRGQAAPLRKCRKGDTVLYTDGPCPAGSREQVVSQDRVTVVPAIPVPVLPAAAAAASGLPNVRDILGRPDDGTLRDQRMERQINGH